MNAADRVISDNFMIPQGAIAIYDGGANLHLDKDGKLNCGTINTQLTGNPGTVLVNKAIDNNNKIIPHIIEGALNIYKDGIFINNFNESDSIKLNNTVILASTSNVTTYNTDNNSILSGIIQNGIACDENKNGNSVLILEPGVAININKNNTEKQNKGQIYGGIVDLTQYIKIDNTSKLTLNNLVITNNGQSINAHVRNAFIKLFNNEDKRNTKQQLTLDNNIDPINNKKNENKILFNKMKFTNCVTEIPSGSGYIGYGEHKKMINNNIKTSQLNYIYNNNLEIVKKLFNGNLNTTITSNTALKQYNLMIRNIDYKELFADLFKKYMEYNCYIQTNDSNNYKISDVISDEVIQNDKKYKVSNEFPLQQANIKLDNNTHIYIQVMGCNVKKIKLTSDNDNSTIHVYNEWIKFGGSIELENIANIVQEYYPINNEYLGYSFPLLQNQKVNYVFKNSGVLNLNYINKDNSNEINFNLNSIIICRGKSINKQNEVVIKKHENAKITNIKLNDIVVRRNAVLRGVSITLCKLNK